MENDSFMETNKMAADVIAGEDRTTISEEKMRGKVVS